MVAIAIVMIIGRKVASRLEVPEAIVPWRQRLVIGWGGMRGAISLAIALTLPLTARGQPFRERPTLIFLAACVVIVTLVGQGLTLAPLVRALGLGESESRRRAETSARAKVVEAGLARLDKMAEDGDKISDDIRRSISRTLDLQERSRRYGLTDTA